MQAMTVMAHPWTPHTSQRISTLWRERSWRAAHQEVTSYPVSGEGETESLSFETHLEAYLRGEESATCRLWQQPHVVCHLSTKPVRRLQRPAMGLHRDELVGSPPGSGVPPSLE